ncbi:hypothetical protein C3K47_07210 [Solitalea longa]|uniref:Uncharacterized protein n=1 Tax=Solitalea longa TaxID=2079460 RepID=A0A2S5A4S8_9SPHI|nr:hypothetical protein [Solitalea longa]POY37545.1 hypothetical protein C3K47_07210 [Solitalea longa]
MNTRNPSKNKLSQWLLSAALFLSLFTFQGFGAHSDSFPAKLTTTELIVTTKQETKTSFYFKFKKGLNDQLANEGNTYQAFQSYLRSANSLTTLRLKLLKIYNSQFDNFFFLKTRIGTKGIKSTYEFNC